MRIFPGQEPANVWVGWITSDFHQYDTSFDLDRVRTVTVTLGDEKGKVHERLVTVLLKGYHPFFFLKILPSLKVINNL